MDASSTANFADAKAFGHSSSSYIGLWNISKLYGTSNIAFGQSYVTGFEKLDGYRGKRFPNSMHPCTHTRVKFVPTPIDITVPNGSRVIGTDCPRDIASGSGLLSFDSIMSYEAASNLTAQLTGQMQQGYSLPMLLLEAGQTLSLGKQIYSTAKAICKVLGKASSEVGVRMLANGQHQFTSHGSAGRTFLREAANVHLLEAFGISPLIKDLRAMWNSSSAIHEYMKQLRALDESSWSPFNAQYSPVDGLRILEPVYTMKGACSSIEVDVQDKSLTASVHAQIRPNGPLPEDVISKAALDYAGMRNPFQGVLWEVKSFSFVVDWIIPVNSAFGRLDDAVKSFGEEPYLQCRRLCWTATARHVSDLYALDYLGIPGKRVKLGRINSSEFRRGIGLPSPSIGSASLQGYGLRQAALSTSLVLQRL